MMFSYVSGSGSTAFAGSAAGFASLAGMLPCGLRRLLAQRRVKCFPHGTKSSWDEGIEDIEGSEGRIEGS